MSVCGLTNCSLLVDGTVDVDGTFDVAASVTGASGVTSPTAGLNHVAVIRNTSTESATGILAIKTGANNPTATLNYITFFDSNEAVGAIEGVSGGVVLDTSSSDMSEWMERIDHAQAMEPGDIVSVIGGKVTRDTRDAFQLQVVSTAPFVAGNAPSEAEKVQWERIAFIGQVPVRVHGRVEVGDYILPSGLNDGTGTARAAAEMDWNDYSLVVGRASEGSEETQIKKVRTVVGLEPRLPQRLMSELKRQRAANRELERRIARLEGLLPGREHSLTSLGATH